MTMPAMSMPATPKHSRRGLQHCTGRPCLRPRAVSTKLFGIKAVGPAGAGGAAGIDEEAPAGGGAGHAVQVTGGFAAGLPRSWPRSGQKKGTVLEQESPPFLVVLLSLEFPGTRSRGCVFRECSIELLLKDEEC